MTNPNEVKIIIHGTTLTGWTDVKITRGIETVPSSFDFGCTEKYPNQPGISIMPGDKCQIYIGDTLVLTGWVDQYVVGVSADKHDVRIRGRSLIEDLVDCSGGIDQEGSFFGNFGSYQTAYQLAQTMAAPFGINVINQSGSNGTQQVPPFQVNEGETAFAVIDRMSKYCGFLTYDDVNGNLILATMGSQGSMASGFVQGHNVQSASIGFCQDQRYSDYYSVWSSTAGQKDDAPYNTNGYASDAGIKSEGRFRPLIIVCEQVQLGQPIGQKRAIWECNRRWGRSQTIKVTCDSWRDTNNTLWQPNAYAPVYIPACKIVGNPTQQGCNGWLIASVTYSLDQNGGTLADVLIMPDLAFSPEPVVLNVWAQDVSSLGAANQQYGGGAAP